VRRVRGTVGNRFADGVLNATRHDAARVVRTAVTHVTTQARQAAFEANSELIAFVRWLSVLDSRTSQICAGLDGQTWPVDRGPRPPAHPNCRSDVVVGLRPVENIPGVDFTKLPPATRASMGGEVPAVQKLGEWLRGQPIATQESILGKAKAALFRRGVVPIKRFVDVPTLRPLKLRELERIEKQINAGKVARLSLR